MEGGGTAVFGRSKAVRDPSSVPMQSRCRVVTGDSEDNIGTVALQDDGDQGCLESIFV